MHIDTAIRRTTVTTSHGSIALQENGAGATTVLFIHGNSSCGDVFQHQLRGQLARNHRLIALDLPGHGQSDNAPDPSRTYSRGGFADAAVELLHELNISDAVIVGWSLGGHIGIDMLTRFQGMRGLMIVGTPPVGRDNMREGFMGLPQTGAAGRKDLSEADIDGFMQATFGERPAFLRDAILRSDGRFREHLFQAMRADDYADQRTTVKNSAVPIAVLNGADDKVINLDYLDRVAYGNLWERRCHRIAGSGHAPFWQQAQRFDSLLARFLDDVTPKPD
ncbi:alpha/beta fold hydrolase [Paraburkholderia bannensis]|uniref:alpha/beta fold hydrolase n=1 Tax=Paraburkholderia bannensis TaxID=765414 RepID=UPI002ABD4358|nr:alpha/beta hydrolase [Paraburkholderia bannensis]